MAVLISGANGQRCRVVPNGLALVLKRRGFEVQAVSELEVEPVVIGVLALRRRKSVSWCALSSKRARSSKVCTGKSAACADSASLIAAARSCCSKASRSRLRQRSGSAARRHGEQSLPVLAFRPVTPAQLNPVLDRSRELAPDRTITDQRTRSRWLECEDINPGLAECRGVLGVDTPLFVGLLARFEWTRLPDFFQLQYHRPRRCVVPARVNEAVRCLQRPGTLRRA